MFGLNSIVIVKNIIFKTQSNNASIDHAFIHGRPCVITHFDKDNIYYFPLSSFHKNACTKGHIILNEQSIYLKRPKYKKFLININVCYHSPYEIMEECGYLKPSVFLNLLERYVEIQKNSDSEEWYEMREYLDELSEIRATVDIGEQLDIIDSLNEKLYEHYHHSKTLHKGRRPFNSDGVVNK